MWLAFDNYDLSKHTLIDLYTKLRFSLAEVNKFIILKVYLEKFNGIMVYPYMIFVITNVVFIPLLFTK